MKALLIPFIHSFDSDDIERVELLRRKPRLHTIPEKKTKKDESEEDLEINSQLKDVECAKCRLFTEDG